MKIKKLPILIIVIILIIAAFYSYNRYNKSSVAGASAQTAGIIEAASKLMILPEGEPIVFDITDPALMASQQAFFANTIAGDKLLMFATSGKAVIWSPSRNIIVNSGPIQSDAEASVVTQATTTKK